MTLGAWATGVAAGIVDDMAEADRLMEDLDEEQRYYGL